MTRPGAAISVRELARAALAEDVGTGDRTTEWTIPATATGSARIVARAPGIIAGTELADAILAEFDAALERDWRLVDGETAEAGAEVVRLSGRLRSILTPERAALNALGRLSGIASLTARYAEAVRGTGAIIVDTRKTTPGWRALEKAATAAGGARNHRMGLYDMVLIKENHIRGAGGIAPALGAVLEPAREEGVPVEIEVTSLAELEEALTGGGDRILLDNMRVPDLAAAVRRVREAPPPRPLLEASGGITLETVRRVAETGVDVISVGAITHSAPALDLSLQVEA